MSPTVARAKPIDLRFWRGPVEGNAEAIAERLRHDFPIGSHVAVSHAVGDWSHELSVERVDEIKVYDADHLAIITPRYVRGISTLWGGSSVAFSFDYRGHMCTVSAKNGHGERVHWIILAVEPEIES